MGEVDDDAGLVYAKKRSVMPCSITRLTTSSGRRVLFAMSAIEADPSSGTADQKLKWFNTLRAATSGIAWQGQHFSSLIS